MSGLAQKGGPVMSHVKVARTPEELYAARIGTGSANLVIGCDLVVAASADALSTMSTAKTCAVINATTAPTAEFVKNPNWQLPGSDLQHDVREACGSADFVAAAEIATSLMGDSIATNMFMLGYAYQKGWVPLSAHAIERAIELNGVAVEFNRKSFIWGRRAVTDLDKVRRAANPADVIPIANRLSRTLDELVERRVKLLTDYQDAAYAARYASLVDRVRKAESEKTGSEELSKAVARYLAKLMAYKDEYEVARLYTDGDFARKIGAMFEGDYKIVYHLAPPLLAKPDPNTGEPKKMQFGRWMMAGFRVLAKLKGMRGTALDIFGHTEERRMERKLVEDYERTVDEIIRSLTPQNHALAVRIASLPEGIRGYGHIKAKSAADARRTWDELLAQFRNPAAPISRAA
jgi:indolepyruvate ferredoxin oxidoreductase